MRVKCINNSAVSLPEHYRSKFVPKAYSKFEWPLVPGKEYIACGLGCFMGCTVYLIQTERDVFPEFLPALLFRVIDGRISSQWRFWAASEFYEHGLECILGYPELADGSNHLDDLVDGKNEAVQLFHRRLKEIGDELSRD